MTRFLVIAAAVLVTAGFKAHRGATGCATSDPAIDALHRDWDVAMSRADVDALLAMTEPRFVLVPAESAPVSGRDLQTRLWSTFGRERVQSRFECEGRVVEGNIAVERGWTVETL
ncbi:MAG TPA: hypothetical protein VJ867_07920, partial [Gemmatimonadaceae bacterium]|nr:hypothetical protein [Gemmatimonadaceae bacterium]